MNQTSIKQAYARLLALKDNLPQGLQADGTYVDEFHCVLDVLQRESEQDLSAFRVPVSEMTKQNSGGDYISGKAYYTGRKECPRALLMMRIDGVLGFFAVSDPKTTVEFKTLSAGQT
jgi:hypothetical protein